MLLSGAGAGCVYGTKVQEENMINLVNLHKSYRTDEVETRALRGVDLQIQKGDFVSIMGPSGCGKSTLLNIIGLIDRPTSGHYYMDDVDVTTCSADTLDRQRKTNVGFVFQSFNLIDELSVEENVELPLVYRGMPRTARRERVKEVLEIVNLAARARHKPNQLSGGQQQRVAVARAVVGDPKVLVADEPTGNLDTKHGDEVMEILKLLNQRGCTIVMVTHSPTHARYSRRIVNMIDGRLVDDSSRANVGKSLDE